MNAALKSDLVAGLRDLYHQNEVARRLFDNLAARQNDIRVTPASRAAVLADASHGEIVALLRKLDELGAGEFKLGRRGSKTRMEWLLSVRSLGAAAQGAANEPEAIDPTQVEDSEAETRENGVSEFEAGESEWIAHTFQLRPDLRLTFKLPVDLTAKEAERLAGFIRQVPFDE
jgi:hypothetical protein